VRRGHGGSENEESLPPDSGVGTMKNWLICSLSRAPFDDFVIGEKRDTAVRQLSPAVSWADNAAMQQTSPHSPRISAALSRRGLIGLAIGLLMLIAIAASSAWQAARNAEALERVDATVATGTLLRNLLLSVDDSETGQRGYLLTGQDDYLTPFTRARAALPALLDELDRRLAGNPTVPALKKAIDAKLAELSRTVDLTRAGDKAGAMAIVLTDAGRDEMARIREMTANLSTNQQVELARQSAAIRTGGRLLIAIDVAGLIVVAGVMVTIGFGLRSYLAALAAARADAVAAYDELAHSNERLDETVRIRTADLTSANDEIQRFAYIVSHDLRAPLVNIMGFTSELEQATHTLVNFAQAADWPDSAREAATDDIPEALRFIKASTSKMDRLINAILKLSREGRRALATERLEMGPLLEDMVATMRHQAKSKDVEVTIGPMPTLWADRVAVEQIFGNVIDNALKYLKPNRPGLIQITARREGPLFRFDVADNGRGIAARDFERVFELFRRSGDQSVQGEGIGLAHVRALVRRLGGGIDCTSTLDAGTIFTIMLPERGSASRETIA
jgi:signal transduction histidine kinase